ncbi:MAG: type II toxin-antitoxin system RelE/ParE family toxin [Coriobacteriia bacterium]|nr:type II toxin-antitoxin system RelE/ParE family toxin [Coriobacteriia bacterium]
MIKTFADKHTEELFLDGKSSVLPPDVLKRAIRKLDRVDTAYRVDDLRVPPGNRLHKLSGDRAGQWSLSINDQWRICFRFEGEDAYDVQVCDYH